MACLALRLALGSDLGLHLGLGLVMGLTHSPSCHLALTLALLLSCSRYRDVPDKLATLVKFPRRLLWPSSVRTQ